MNLLLSAYACEPGLGSEPGIGWNSVLEAGRFHDVWVLTRHANRAAIKQVPAPERVHFVYLDLPGWARFWKKGRRGLYFYYSLWQILAYIRARRLHSEIGFDAVQHVTFMNYWAPGWLALLPAPFIWGPVGGGESAPRAFRAIWSPRSRLHEALRDLARARARWDPLVRFTARHAALALATTEETRARLKELGCRRVRVEPGAALPDAELRILGRHASPPSEPFRLLSIGRLVHWKGFSLALEAFKAFLPSDPDAQHWIIGDGPERPRLEALAERLGIAHRVIFFGALPRSRVLAAIGRCHVLVHPSFHDSAGWVCLEAMAASRPVICLDLGGPGLQVTTDAGIKIRASTPEETVEALATAFQRLHQDPSARVRLGRAGRRHVEQNFRWARKAGFYENLANETAVADWVDSGRTSSAGTHSSA